MPHAFRVTRTIARPAEEVWTALTGWDDAARWTGVARIRAEGPTAVGTRMGVTADYRYTLDPDGDATRLTLVADVTTRGPWRSLAPVIRTAIRRTDAGQLDALAGALGD